MSCVQQSLVKRRIRRHKVLVERSGASAFGSGARRMVVMWGSRNWTLDLLAEAR